MPRRRAAFASPKSNHATESCTAKGTWLMRLTSIVLAAFFLMAAAHTAHAQDQDDAPIHPHYKTADRSFWLWTAAAYGSGAAELEITQACLHSGRCTGDINPLLGTHRAQAYAVSMGVTTLTTYLSYRWKRHSTETLAAGVTPKTAWWTPQLIDIGGHGIGIGLTFALRR